MPGGNRIDLPATEYRVGDSVGAIAPPFSPAVGKLVDRARDPPVANVEVAGADVEPQIVLATVPLEGILDATGIEHIATSVREFVRVAGARASEVDKELMEGLTAYAREQEDREKRTSEILAAKWGRIRQKGRAYLARETLGSDGIVGDDIVVLLDDEEEAEGGDEEEGIPDYEDEGDDEVLE